MPQPAHPREAKRRAQKVAAIGPMAEAAAAAGTSAKARATPPVILSEGEMQSIPPQSKDL
jgi:hypothetical protein